MNIFSHTYKLKQLSLQHIFGDNSLSISNSEDTESELLFIRQMLIWVRLSPWALSFDYWTKKTYSYSEGGNNTRIRRAIDYTPKKKKKN